jgi:hypothetical protein
MTANHSVTATFGKSPKLPSGAGVKLTPGGASHD